jgi:hypothetical protein
VHDGLVEDVLALAGAIVGVAHVSAGWPAPRCGMVVG